MNKQNTRRGFTQNNKVILNLIQDLQRLPLSLRNDMRGRFQIKFGMTSSYNNGGFTLIELLVVVLIIGILAAIAVPQYKVAVIKSRVATLLSLARSIQTAQEIYYLQNGTYTPNPELLDIEIPKDCTKVLSNAETGRAIYSCGKDFLLDTSDGTGTYINYCPNKNDTWDNCSGNREFQIAFKGNFFIGLGNDEALKQRGTKVCAVFKNSSLGNKICSNFGFEKISV